MMKRLKDNTVGWTAVAIGVGTAATPAWMATTPAGAGITLALGAATVLYGREGRLQPVDIGGGASAFWPDDVNALRTRAP